MKASSSIPRAHMMKDCCDAATRDPHHWLQTLELETKVKERFAKISKCLIAALMIIASSQFHVYLPLGQRRFSIVS